MRISEIGIGDSLEVTSRPGWNGLRLKVTRLEPAANTVYGTVTRAIDNQPRWSVGKNTYMYAHRFELVERKKEFIGLGHLVEVTSGIFLGLQYEVSVVQLGLVSGHVTKTIVGRKDYPVGTLVNFYPGKVKIITLGKKSKSIFAKKGGWGP